MGQGVAPLVRRCLSRQEMSTFNPSYCMPPPLNETASKQQSLLPHCNATQHRHVLMSLPSSHITPCHTSTAPAHAAIRLCTATLPLIPRFVVALVHLSRKHISAHVYVCLARRSTTPSQMRWRCSFRSLGRYRKIYVHFTPVEHVGVRTHGSHACLATNSHCCMATCQQYT